MRHADSLVPLSIVLALASCQGVPAEEKLLRGDCRPGVYPRLVMCPDEVRTARSRLTTPPYSGMYQRARAEAQKALVTPTSTYDNDTEGTNARVAKHAALVALMEQDAAMGLKAIDGISRLKSDWTFGVGLGDADRFIRIVGFLQDALEGFDLVMGSGYASAEQRAAMERALGAVAGKLYEMWIKGPGALIVKVTQNNYNTKLSTTLGLAALMLDNDANRDTWLAFAATESNRFYGDGVSDENLYLDEAGVCKEPPSYFHFGGRAALPFALLYEQMVGPGASYTNVCSVSTAQCKPGPITLDGILRSPRFMRAYEWMARIQQPDGQRPSIDEGRTTGSPPAGGLWQRVAGASELPLWDVVFSNRGDDLHRPEWAGYYLARVDFSRAPKQVAIGETQLLERSGQVIFRSGWEEDAIYAVVLGESGLLRSMVHNHADATSFQLYAYGEPLALDSGYFEPAGMDPYAGRAMTVGPEAHNLILVDGKGAPKPALFGAGDVDATMQHSVDTAGLDYTEVRAAYQGVEVTRGVLFASERYLVLADTLRASAPHTYAWRLHGFGGGSSLSNNYTTGQFSLGGDGAVWTRSRAKLKLVLDSTLGRPVLKSGTFPHEWISGQEGYHSYVDGEVSSAAGAADVGYLAVVFPQRAASAFPAITVHEAADGVACVAVRGGGHEDLAGARVSGGGRVALAVKGFSRIETDAAFFWLSLDSAGRPSRAFIRGGTKLIYGGTKVIDNATAQPTALYPALASQ